LVPLVAVLGFSVGPAAAASFNFSYVFDTGTTVDGMLEGDISPTDPNLVENVVVTMVVIDEGVVAPFVPTSTSPDHNAVSFNGSHMDLEVEGLFDGLFAVIFFNLDGQAGISAQQGIVFEVFEPSRWELTPAATAVPSGGSLVRTTLVLALVLVGWVGLASGRSPASRDRSIKP
jgi:hypothetical protein